MKHYSDAQLILELKNDDHLAFKEIYDRYADKLIALALKKTSDEDEATDMVQELFLSVWKNRSTMQLNGMLEAYLTVSINYMIFKWYKKQRIQPQTLNYLSEEQHQCEDSTSQNLIFAELNFIINQEIAGMPEKMRQVYLCSREQDMNGQQIAEQLGVSHQTVRNQISNALSRIRKSVHRYNNNIINFNNFSEFLLLIIFLRHL